MNKPWGNIWEQAITLYHTSLYKVEAVHYRLDFKYPFRLASGIRSATNLVFLKINCQNQNNLTGYGEASLPPYLEATVQSVMAYYKLIDWNTVLSSPINTLATYLDSVKSGNNAAKASVDMAMHDLKCRECGKTLGEYYQIDDTLPVYSTFTIAISNEKELIAKLKEAKDFKIIKLKLGSPDDKIVIDTFLKKSKKIFCVDINQGWHSRDEAARLSAYLASKKVLFIEQPFHQDKFEDSQWLRGRVEVPIIADESVKVLADVNLVKDVFDGINIKLMKSGGIAEAVKMVHRAKAIGMKIVIGAMAESSLANTAAAHIAPLADWVDLDGAMLSTNNPFNGIEYDQGQLKIPHLTGIGAKEK